MSLFARKILHGINESTNKGFMLFMDVCENLQNNNCLIRESISSPLKHKPCIKNRFIRRIVLCHYWPYSNSFMCVLHVYVHGLYGIMNIIYIYYIYIYIYIYILPLYASAAFFSPQARNKTRLDPPFYCMTFAIYGGNPSIASSDKMPAMQSFLFAYLSTWRIRWIISRVDGSLRRDLTNETTITGNAKGLFCLHKSP